MSNLPMSHLGAIIVLLSTASRNWATEVGPSHVDDSIALMQRQLGVKSRRDHVELDAEIKGLGRSYSSSSVSASPVERHIPKAPCEDGSGLRADLHLDFRNAALLQDKARNDTSDSDGEALGAPDVVGYTAGDGVHMLGQRGGSESGGPNNNKSNHLGTIFDDAVGDITGSSHAAKAAHIAGDVVEGIFGKPKKAFETECNETTTPNCAANKCNSARTKCGECKSIGFTLKDGKCEAIPPSPKCLVNVTADGICLSQNYSEQFSANTTCLNGQCYCQEGFCAAANGSCYTGAYKLLLDNFTITNARHPGEYVFLVAEMMEDATETNGSNETKSANVSYSFGLSRDKSSNLSRFMLYEMPDGAVLLYSKAFPNFSISIDHDFQYKKLKKKPVKRGDTKAQSLLSTGSSKAIAADDDLGTCTSRPTTDIPYWKFDIKLLDRELSTTVGAPAYLSALELFRPPNNSYRSRVPHGAVMIGSYRYPSMYLYSDESSDQVGVFREDSGDNAVWIFNPPLPADFRLKAFEGKVCSFDCFDSRGDVRSLAYRQIAVSAVILVILCCCCLCICDKMGEIELKSTPRLRSSDY